MDRTAPRPSSRLLLIAVVAAVAWASNASAATVPGWQPMAPVGGLAPRGAAGSPAVSMDFPSVGALLTGGKAENAVYACSGVLIGCETFLTAARCVCSSNAGFCEAFPPDPSQFFVFLPEGGLLDVASISIHPQFSFDENDVAVLRLRRPVDGIAPLPINQAGTPLDGSRGTIVGFGDLDGFGNGIERSLSGTTHSCGGSDSFLCWNLDPPPPDFDANRCVGDPGSPFIGNIGGVPTAVSLTSSGPFSCVAQANGVADNIFALAGFLADQAGGDLGGASCGCLPNAGGADAPIFSATGELSSSITDGRHVVSVPAGADRLRITMNAETLFFSDFDPDLYVRQGSPPTAQLFDCRQSGDGLFASCEFDHPTAGDWYILVRRATGNDATPRSYQLTATVFSGASASDGKSCDDGNPCTGSDQCGDGTCRGNPLSGIACDDGDACTTNDACVFGKCVSDPVICEGDADQCHDGATCNSAIGCVTLPKPDFTPCDPQGAVTCRSQSSICVNGACAEPEDFDGDKICDLDDNCVLVPNPSQLDGDHDGIGNACDDSDVPLRIQSVKLLGRHGDARPNGRMMLKAEFTAISPDAFDPTRGLAMRITDSLNLSRVIQWTKGRCTTSPDDVTTCKNRDATRTLSIRKLSSTTPGTVTYVVRFRAVGLPLDTPFVPPVHATLVDGPGVFVRGTDRVGTTGNCRSTDAGLTCASPYAPPAAAFVGGATASLLD